jgi:prolyl 4-hydroxylase
MDKLVNINPLIVVEIMMVLTIILVIYIYWDRICTSCNSLRLHEPFENYEGEYKVLHDSKPRVMTLINFMTPEECKHVLALCADRYKRSGVMQNDGNTGVEDVRTSHSCFIREAQDDVVRRIESKAAKAAGVNVDQIEGLQIVRYYPGEKYDAHNDWFHHGDKDTQEKNQRYVTILVYLNDDFEGGTTDFVNLGLKVKPVKGNAVMWDNCWKNGNTNDTCHENAKHQGSAPTKGVKYAMNIWTRFNKYRQ